MPRRKEVGPERKARKELIRQLLKETPLRDGNDVNCIDIYNITYNQISRAISFLSLRIIFFSNRDI